MWEPTKNRLNPVYTTTQWIIRHFCDPTRLQPTLQGQIKAHKVCQTCPLSVSMYLGLSSLLVRTREWASGPKGPGSESLSNTANFTTNTISVSRMLIHWGEKLLKASLLRDLFHLFFSDMWLIPCASFQREILFIYFAQMTRAPQWQSQVEGGQATPWHSTRSTSVP